MSERLAAHDALVNGSGGTAASWGGRLTEPAEIAGASALIELTHGPVTCARTGGCATTYSLGLIVWRYLHSPPAPLERTDGWQLRPVPRGPSRADLWRRRAARRAAWSRWNVLPPTSQGSKVAHNAGPVGTV